MKISFKQALVPRKPLILQQKLLNKYYDEGQEEATLSCCQKTFGALIYGKRDPAQLCCLSVGPQMQSTDLAMNSSFSAPKEIHLKYRCQDI